MFQSKKVIFLSVLFVVSLFVFRGSALAQEKLSCVFVRTSKPERHIWDQPLIDHLEKTYDVTPVSDDTIMNGDFTVDDLKKFDFCFVSESTSSWRMAGAPTGFFKNAHIPMFNAELYSAKPSIAGYVSASSIYGAISDSSGEGGKVLIVDDTHHYLSAGFALGAEIEITTDTDDENYTAILTYCIPEIDYIPIAVSSENPELVVVFGVEAGTALWDSFGLAIDPSLVNENRKAAVGLYSRAHSYITEDGFKLIDTGIEWILGRDGACGDCSAVEDEVVKPVAYCLTQNYPNPFNLTTEVSFTLRNPGYVTLTIYNIAGETIATLVDDEMSVGAHHVTFRAENISSGIYFYRLRSGDFTKVRKMTLMK